jgi:hypothetical protein
VVFLVSSGYSLYSLLYINLETGLLASVILGAFLAWNVLSQPKSEHSTGLNLALDIAWSGVFYGFIYSVLLSVMPVQIMLLAFPSQSNIPLILLGVLASIIVTLFYHIGFKEFRNKSLLKPVIGNSLCTFAFLLTGNALSAIVSHIIMHVTAVYHGPRYKEQLPPHYSEDGLLSSSINKGK